MRKIYRSLIRLASVLLFLFSILAAYAQQRMVTGKVSDATGGSMPGVNVVKKGTTAGAVTDVNGEFSIEASENDVFVISFIGYKTQEIRVGTQTALKIALEEDVATLGEVVVIGYGTQKKSDLTGAVSSVSGETVRGTLTANIDQALQGRIAGVQVSQNSGQPGSAVSIRIRGTNSITGSGEPLYVIDGVQMSGNAGGIAGFDWAGGSNGQGNITSPLAGFNPSDIESIEVLKDASASAIYGSRAANGVVLITTKRGKPGEAKITYNGYYGLQETPKTLDMMDLREYAAYQYSISQEIPSITVDDRFRDPSLLGTGTNWQDAVFRVAPLQSHTVSANGGTDKTQYAISGGYFAQDGIIEGSGFERFSTRINLDTKVRDWIKVGTSLNFSITDEVIGRSDGGDGIIAQALQTPPSIPVRDIDGNFAGDKGSAQVGSNPVAVAQLINNTLKRQSFISNSYAELSLVKGLTFRTEYAITSGHSLNKVFLPTYTWGRIVNDANMLRHREENNSFWIWKNYLTYDRSFNKHHFTLVAGQEAQKNNYEGSVLTKVNLTSNDIQVPNQGEPSAIDGWKGANALSSYFGRLIYNFDDRYYITAMMRRDGSSRFGPNNRWGNFGAASFAWRITNEKFMPQIPFLTDLKLRVGYGEVGNEGIPNYAFGSALQTISNTAFGTLYIPDRISNPGLMWEATATTNIGLDMSLLGGRIDVTLDGYHKFSNGLLLELNPPSYVLGTLINPPYSNFGKIENKGFEVNIASKNIVSGKFSWSTDLNYATNRNKITQIDKDYTQNLYWYAGFQTVTNTTLGQPIGQFYGYETEGIFTSEEDILNHAVQAGTSEVNPISQRDGLWLGDMKFKDQLTVDTNGDGVADAGDGVINQDDQVLIGNPNPKGTIGFNNTFRYGPFSLNVNIISVFGFDVFNYQGFRNSSMQSGFDNQLNSVKDRARFEMIDPSGNAEDINNYRLINPGAKLFRFSQLNANGNTRMSDLWIEDGSFIRIQNISLAYELPKSLVSRAHLSSVRAYVNAQNVYTFTNYSGYDPNVGAFNQGSMMQNIDMGRIPVPRIYTIGIDIGF